MNAFYVVAVTASLLYNIKDPLKTSTGERQPVSKLQAELMT